MLVDGLDSSNIVFRILISVELFSKIFVGSANDNGLE